MPAFDTLYDGPSLTVRVRTGRDATAVVSVTGEIDRDSRLQVQRVVTDVVRRERSRRIVVDLSEVTFLDAAGIRALLTCRGVVERRGARLEVRRPQIQVRRVLDITGVVDLLHLPAA